MTEMESGFSVNSANRYWGEPANPNLVCVLPHPGSAGVPPGSSKPAGGTPALPGTPNPPFGFDT
ncbi:hypothetical protein FACS189475_03360 [Betaproteobacteria bacterium]|nr:hypothetical protein FACS189475_03360 [Betaproteobacteria bacterium]